MISRVAQVTWTLSLGVAIPILAACGELPIDWCAGGAGVPAVFNDGPGEWSGARLEEVWRTGGADDENALAGPNAPAVRHDGLVAVPDAMSAEVLIIEGDGTWRRPALTKGGGPWGVNWPVAVGWTTDDHLVTLDLEGGRVVRLDVDAERDIVDEWRIPAEVFGPIYAAGELPGVVFTADGSVLLELPWTAPPDGSTDRLEASLVRISATGAVDTVARLGAQVVGAGPEPRFPRPGGTRPIYATDASGAIAIGGESPDYRIRILTPDWRDSLTICRASSSLPLTAAERGDGAVEEWEIRRSEAVRASAPVERPLAYGRLFFGSGGRLWVQRDRPDPLRAFGPVEGATYDVFAPGGRYLGEVRAPERTILGAEASAMVFGMQRGPFDEPMLVAYRFVAGS